MNEVFEILGAVQSHGGMMLVLLWLVFTVRQHISDFNNHSHNTRGVVYIKKRASDKG